MSKIIWMIVHHPRLAWVIIAARVEHTIKVMAEIHDAISEVSA